MRKAAPILAAIWLAVCPCLFRLTATAASQDRLIGPRIKVLKVSITNPTNETHLQENVVLSVADLKRVAPDFKAGDVIVTTSEAATLEEDARTLQTVELPSQADDLDGDNKFRSI